MEIDREEGKEDDELERDLNDSEGVIDIEDEEINRG